MGGARAQYSVAGAAEERAAAVDAVAFGVVDPAAIATARFIVLLLALNNLLWLGYIQSTHAARMDPMIQ